MMGVWRFTNLDLHDMELEEFITEATAPYHGEKDGWDSIAFRTSARYVAEALVRSNPDLAEFRHPDAEPA